MRNEKVNGNLVARSGTKEKKVSKIFKPLVASSLALALGVSVGNATIKDTIQATTANQGENFSDETTINHGIGSIGGYSTTITFSQGATIGAFDNSTKISDDSVGSAIFISGNGTNTITFEGTTNKIIGNITTNTGTNIINLNANATIASDIITSGTRGENRFNVAGDSFTMQNSETPSTAYTLTTQSGTTSLNMNGSGAAQAINANLTTSGGNATITLSSNADTVNFNGSITTTGGTTTVKLNPKNNGIITFSQPILTSGGTTKIIYNSGWNDNTTNFGAITTNNRGTFTFLSQDNISVFNKAITADGEGSTNTITVRGNIATFNEDISATNGGKNIFIIYDRWYNKSIVFEDQVELSATSHGKNTIKLGQETGGPHAYVLKSSSTTGGEIIFSGDKTGTNEILFNLNADSPLNIQNSNSTQTFITLNTTSGNTIFDITKLTSHTATINGNIKTSGGSTEIKTGSTTILNGNLITSDGTSTITFANNATFTFGANNTLSASGAGTLILNLSDSTTTIKGGSGTSGNLFTDGINIINFKTGNTSLAWQNQAGSSAQNITTDGGTTNINLVDESIATITGSAISTSNGATNINFAGTSTLNASEITTTGGSTTFNLGLVDGTSENITAKVDGNISNSAENTFYIHATNVIFQNSGLIFSDGTNNITFKKDGATLNWQDGDGATQAISTSGGTTNINFNYSGTITSGIETSSSGNTTIAIGGKSGTIQGAISTTSGTTNVVFAGTGALTLQGDVNQITSLSASSTADTYSTLVIDGSRNENTTTINSLTNGANLNVRLAGAESKNATLAIVDSGTNNKTISLNSVILADNSAYNTLDLTALTSTTVEKAINVSATQGLNINLKDTTLTLNNGWTTAEGGASVINVGSDSTTSSTSILKGGDVTLKELNLKGTSSSIASMTLQNTSTTIDTLSAGATTSNTFKLDGANSTGGSSAVIKNAISGSNLTIALGGNTSNKAELTLRNANNVDSTINSLSLSESNSSADKNVLNLQARKTSITDGITIGANQTTQGLTINLANAELASNITNQGIGIINFNGTTSSKITGDISTSGSSKTTTFNVKASAKGFVNGNITLENNGENIVTIGENGTLTLQGADNKLTSVSSTTSGTLSLNGYNSTSGVSANLSSPITDNATILNFNGTSGKKAEMTLSAGDNELKAITLGNGNGSATADNKLILSTGNTTIAKALNISAYQGIAFDLDGNSTLTFSEDISNASALGTSDGGLTFNIKGGSGNTNTITGNISTGGTTQGVDGTTTFNIADSSSGVTVGNITISANTDNSSTNINFENGSNAKSFALQGENNQITNVTSNGIQNTLALDTTSNAVSAEVTNAISGANSLTIALGGNANNKAELTLNNTNADSTIKSLSLSESNSSVGNNVFNLQARKTSIADGITIDADQTNQTTQGLTINLANAELASNITNQGIGIINFNDTTSSKITGDISTSGSSKTTTFNVKASAKGFVNGSITLSESGKNIITIGNGGTLTLQGANNQLTSVSSDTSGILSLDGASNSSGVTASVSSAITGDSTTLNFNGTSGKKAEMTLSVGDNELKAITLGANATNNKLILSEGSTSINDAMNVGIGQEIAFDLGNNTANNTSISFDDSVNNSGGIINILNNTTNPNGANITLKSLSVSGTGGVNTIGKSTIASGDDFETNITNAFVGTLKIAEGISSSAGSNDIFFKATNSQNSTIIASNNNKIAINATSGENNIFLDISDANIQAGTQAIVEYLTNLTSSPDTACATFANNAAISGNIVGSPNGTINLKIIGTANDDDGDKAQIGILGNIQNNRGNINVILKDTIFAPSQLVKSNTPIDIGGDYAGNITTTAGTTTVVTRFTNASLTPSGVSMYKINNSEGGTTNIVLQGNVDIGANIDYTSNGVVNLIFANHFEETDTNFSSTLNINKLTGEVTAFGTTYQDGIRLTLQDKEVASGDGQKSFLALSGADKNPYVFSFDTKRISDASGNSTDTVTLRGVAVGEISSLGESGKASYNYNITLESDAIYLGNISLSKATQNVSLTMNQGSKLFTDNELLVVNNLIINDTEIDYENLFKNSFVQNSTIIDLGTEGNDFGSIKERENFRVLLIGNIPTNENDAQVSPANISTKTTTGLTGNNALFRVYVNPNATDGVLGNGQNGTQTYAYSDRVIVTNGTEGKHYIQAIYNSGIDISHISYKEGTGTETQGNIAVATVANGTNITFEGVQQIQGFDLVGTTLATNNDTGIDGTDLGTGYTTYFIESVSSTGASPVNTEVTTSALGLNYELFLANFNSLNKRMGELRNNDNGQGAWGRIFNGMLSTSYGLETKSIYTTIQAGYDYAFGFEGANNYLGVALSYANSMSKSSKKLDIDGSEKGLNDSTTHGVEVALYNSYVEDSGWFNDTIVKFSYMMSDLNILGQNITYNSNNYGLVFSDEFGYRFKLGSEKEWYIDPQLEVGLGYFNQSNLKQVLGDASLDGIQDAIMTLRARVGANWAYDFKRFTQGKGINASVYVGTYYSYDYINGGEISLTTNLGKNTNLTPLASTGRFELNVGTNVEIKDNTRIYFDFERSFGGTITTEYQVNVGVRYSFGENTGYKPVAEEAEFKTPLKVEGEESKEGDKEVKEDEEKKEESKNTKDKDTKLDSKESKNTKTAKTLDKAQPKEKPSK